MEFSNETIRIPKRTLESDRERSSGKEQDDHEESENKRTRYVQIPPGSAGEVSPEFVESESQGISESDNDLILDLSTDSPEVLCLLLYTLFYI